MSIDTLRLRFAVDRKYNTSYISSYLYIFIYIFIYNIAIVKYIHLHLLYDERNGIKGRRRAFKEGGFIFI